MELSLYNAVPVAYCALVDKGTLAPKCITDPPMWPHFCFCHTTLVPETEPPSYQWQVSQLLISMKDWEHICATDATAEPEHFFIMMSLYFCKHCVFLTPFFFKIKLLPVLLPLFRELPKCLAGPWLPLLHVGLVFEDFLERPFTLAHPYIFIFFLFYIQYLFSHPYLLN